MDKQIALQKVKDDMEQDRSLPLITKPQDVIPGDGNPNAEIVFIGEAGGYYESIQRKPFVGNAGMLLNQLLRSINISRESVYITNMVKTRPPSNRDPLPNELVAYGEYLDREIGIVQPKIIVTLGRFSMGKFLPNARISSVHGKKFAVNWGGKEIVVVPMYHPAAALRSNEIMLELKEDFKRIPQILKETKQKIDVEQTSFI